MSFLKWLEYADSSSVLHRTEYRYSGDGFLAIIRKFENSSLVDEIRIVRDGFLAVQDRDENNAVVREYTWGLNLGGGIGGLLNLKQGGQDYAYLYDGKGNVAAVLDGSQSVVAAYRYAPFGKLLATTGTLDQPFGFSTKRYDPQTGMIEYGLRRYAPAIGRWTTRDPLGEEGGMNLYAFVGNNPVNWMDPLGLWVSNNSQGCKVYFKPGGKNDNPHPLLDESDAVELPPGTCPPERSQDGVAIPSHPKYPDRVLKIVNGVNVVVNPDCSVTLFYETLGARAKQLARGGWKKQRWNKKREEKRFFDWSNIFDVVEEK